MTMLQFDALLKRVDMHNAVIPCRTSVRAWCPFDALHGAPADVIRASIGEEAATTMEYIVETIFEAPDRDAGFRRSLSFGETVRPQMFFGEDDAVRWLLNHYDKIYLHEVREAFHVDRVRKFDPHARKSP